MGRKAIKIQYLTDERNRSTTLRKRTDGLLKKARDLCESCLILEVSAKLVVPARLCAHELAVIVTRPSGSIYAYWSTSSLDRVYERAGHQLNTTKSVEAYSSCAAAEVTDQQGAGASLDTSPVLRERVLDLRSQIEQEQVQITL